MIRRDSPKETTPPSMVSIDKQGSINISSDSSEPEPSDCLKLLERINAPLMTQGEWEGIEIDKVNGEPVSLTNSAAKKLQEVFQKKSDIQANYGPFIMEKTEIQGGKFIQETNPDLIKCAQNKLIVSIWQP
jgi:hypothetical protein